VRIIFGAVNNSEWINNPGSMEGQRLAGEKRRGMKYHISPETHAKLSKLSSKRNSGLGNGMYGRKHSAETLAKMRNARAAWWKAKEFTDG
jgi:hypothetical protein